MKPILAKSTESYSMRAVELVLLKTGFTMAHKVSTSLEVTRTGVEMWWTPTGVHVTHLATGEEHFVPHDNIYACKFLKAPSKPLPEFKIAE